MGKRYYCEYCERSFKGDFVSRQNHLKGTQHFRSRTLFYKLHRDLKTLYEEESVKPECHRFRNTGDCSFGILCNRRHYSEWELAAFKAQIDHEEITTFHEKLRVPHVSEWFVKQRNSFQPRPGNAYKLALPCPPLPHLPPSLQPLTTRDLVNAEFVEWG